MVTLKSFLGMIAAVPFIMACNQTGQVNATLFPASGSENVNPDTHLVLTFSETPVLGDSGMIRVYDCLLYTSLGFPVDLPKIRWSVGDVMKSPCLPK